MIILESLKMHLRWNKKLQAAQLHKAWTSKNKQKKKRKQKEKKMKSVANSRRPPACVSEQINLFC